MNAKDILEEQVIVLKRGRMNGLGFEPAWNVYFDFYLDAKWFGKPLLELQDVAFHLYLRKNLNDRNKAWKMPTIRQMKKKFDVSQDKVEAMLKRLDWAHLLKKESGFRKGEDHMNVRNNYILSDPIPTLDEFLTVAGEGAFGVPLKPEWLEASSTIERQDESIQPCTGNRYTDVPEVGTIPVPEIGTDQHTSSFQQTSEKQTINPLWEEVLVDFKMQLPPKTFEMFLIGTDLVSIKEDVAIISTINGYAKDWIENRMANKIKYALKVEGVRCVVLTEI